MKPAAGHPRICKTIKWGGLAMTALLGVLWIGSFWLALGWFSRRSGSLSVYRGGLTVFYHAPSEQDRRFVGWRLDWIDDDFPAWTTWWFHALVLRDWRTWSRFSAPLWCPLAISLGITSVAWRLDFLARRRARLNLCPKCGYDRTGLPDGGTATACPEVVRCRHEAAPANPCRAAIGWNGRGDSVGGGVDRHGMVDGSR